MAEMAYSRPLPYFDHTIYNLGFKEAKDAVIKAFRQHYISAILRQNRGNISRAAEQAGVQRQYLHRLMKDEDIHAESFKDDTSNL